MPIRKRKIQRSVIIKQVGQTSRLVAAQISISHFSKTIDLRSGARRSCIIVKSISMHTNAYSEFSFGNCDNYYLTRSDQLYI